MSHRTLLPIIAMLGSTLAGCGDEGRTEWGAPWNPSGITAGQDGDDGDDESSGSQDAAEDTASDNADTNADTDDLTTGLTAAEESGDESSSGGSLPPPSPYQGEWDIGTCQDMVSSTVPDMSLTDHFGDSVRIYDFCHKAILLVGGAFW